MIEIPLQSLPNQQLAIQLDGALYTIYLKDIIGLMAISIIRDGVTIIEGERMVPRYPILPYQYQEAGNFVILTANEDYPDWHQFGITQSLIYASQAELEAIRGT